MAQRRRAGPRRPSDLEAGPGYFETALAAVTMKSETSAGCDR